jgi:hypothetical protein
MVGLYPSKAAAVVGGYIAASTAAEVKLFINTPCTIDKGSKTYKHNFTMGFQLSFRKSNVAVIFSPKVLF